MLAEVIDAVIGIDTHRDTHEVEIADAAGRPIAVLRIGNDSGGFTQLPAAISEVAPGSRVAVCIEGTRGYGRAGAGAGSGLTAGDRVQAAQAQTAPREGQVRPDRRPPGGAGRAAPGHRPAAGAPSRR